VNRFIYLSLFSSLWFCLFGCTPITSTVSNQYTLTFTQPKVHYRTHLPYALLISKPEAMAGYRTEQMLYIKQRFALAPFAKSAWSSPPADMLYPLLMQGFQDSHAFRAISSSPYADKADYRLDTQLIALHQNFLSEKSRLQWIAKITVTRITDNYVLASRLITLNLPCPSHTPYGGVIAANQASSIFINQTLDFVVKQVRADKGGQKI
jgi:cholesterol transport system auxiliary component